MFNWMAQVFSVTRFSMLSLPQRKGSSAAALLGIAGVVAVMVGVLSIAQGVMKTMESSAGDTNVIVLRSGADSEMMSGLGGDDTRIIAEAPGIARDASGPVSSPELFVVINLPMRSTGTDANVPLRGVQAQAQQVRDGFRLVEGRMFEWGLNEVIVGVGARQQFAGLEIGSSIEVGKERWP
ncbi:MAG: ABC transporter permease, partial [Gammaproteobacteria bacterium]|nr:ABC transporter permease [Gammaproteobacteria bacterium]